LKASGADCVGYNEMLFWRTVKLLPNPDDGNREAEAWLYTATRGGVPALGTSLCYWRKTWERHHFANETQGVEDHWMREKNVMAIGARGEPFQNVEHPELWMNAPSFQALPDHMREHGLGEPRMIARIHGRNTSNGYNLEDHVAKGSREWKRVPEWNSRVREILG
jgi:hypothetical protein